MIKLLKKFFLSIFIAMILIIPNVVLANETYTPVLELTVEDGIMPLLDITSRPVIQNGETEFFINSNTNQPFLFIEDSKIEIKLTFNSITTCIYGLASENGTKLISNTCLGKTSTSFIVEVPYTGKFKFFIENYGTDPVSINKFEVLNSYL